jgi:hypothetical protein
MQRDLIAIVDQAEELSKWVECKHCGGRFSKSHLCPGSVEEEVLATLSGEKEDVPFPMDFLEEESDQLRRDMSPVTPNTINIVDRAAVVQAVALAEIAMDYKFRREE